MYALLAPDFFHHVLMKYGDRIKALKLRRSPPTAAAAVEEGLFFYCGIFYCGCRSRRGIAAVEEGFFFTAAYSTAGATVGESAAVEEKL